MKELELVHKLNDGNRIVFNELFKMYYSNICSFGNNFITDRSLVEDIVQEAFIILWEKRDSFDSINGVKSFLHVVVRNKCLNHIRDSKKISILDDTDFRKILSEDFFLEKIIAEEYYSQLYQLIQTLPPRTQEVLNLSMRGLNQSEISEELDIEISTVKSHKKIAYKTLRKGFEVFVFAMMLN
ncbi:MAG: RNA polymerase sigma factor [Labilibaculum antarcticum]